MLLHFPDHCLASTGSGRKKASIGTSSPESALSRLASPREASLRPAKMLRRCHSEHSTDDAMAGTVIPLRAAQSSIGCLSDMTASISTGNSSSQTELFLSEIASVNKALLEWTMGKTKQNDEHVLHLGQWLALFEVNETAAAKAGHVGQSYIANLIAGRKKNPNALILLRISEMLGITVNDLYRRPPSRSELAPVADLSPRAREAIVELQRRRKMG